MTASFQYGCAVPIGNDIEGMDGKVDGIQVEEIGVEMVSRCQHGVAIVMEFRKVDSEQPVEVPVEGTSSQGSHTHFGSEHQVHGCGHEWMRDVVDGTSALGGEHVSDQCLHGIPRSEFDPRIDLESGIDEFRQAGLFEQGHGQGWECLYLLATS